MNSPFPWFSSFKTYSNRIWFAHFTVSTEKMFLSSRWVLEQPAGVKISCMLLFSGQRSSNIQTAVTVSRPHFWVKGDCWDPQLINADFCWLLLAVWKNTLLDKLLMWINNTLKITTVWFWGCRTGRKEGYGLFQGFFGHQGDFSGSGVTREVVAGAVSTAHDLNPALREKKKIPVSACVNNSKLLYRFVWVCVCGCE